MSLPRAIVVTSISAPNDILRALAGGARAHDFEFIVIGDVASPDDFQLDGCRFFSMSDQLGSGFALARACPTRHYARKNMGYLIAIRNGARQIIETDDDNDPVTPDVPMPDGNGGFVNNNCLNCHTPTDPLNANAPRVPAGQLDLFTDAPRDVAIQHSVYRELLVTDNLQVLENGVVVDFTQIIQDVDGNDITIFTPVAPPASVGSARASSDFFDRIINPNNPSYAIHGDIMSRAELRLIAEWLDVGAQYYNNPFDAPAN